MPYLDPQMVAEAKRIDLLTYLQSYSPGELVHVSGDTYCTRAHDSLKISNGKWCWFSRGIGGSTALDYLIKVEGFSFTQAVEAIVGRGGRGPQPMRGIANLNSQALPRDTEIIKTLELPAPATNTQRAVAYLKQRGISSELIAYCIDTGRIYESLDYHNVVFVGHDGEGAAKYASVRGTGSQSFKGDCSGSDKRYSFCIPAVKESATVHLFEGPIDLLSFATLLKMHGRDFRAEHLLSLSGVYQPKRTMENSKLPMALTQFLKDHPNVDRVVLRLDSDPVGRLAAQAIAFALPSSYKVEIRPPPSGKDYNDYLCALLERRKESPKEPER